MPYNQEDLFSPAVLPHVAHLPELLLQRIECALMIRYFDPDLFTRLGLDFEELYKQITCIAKADLVHAELRTRATIMRILTTYKSDGGHISKLWVENDDEAASESALQIKLLHEIQGAIRVHKSHGIKNSGFLHFTLSLVQKQFGLRYESDWNTTWTHIKFGIHRNDLLFTFFSIMYVASIYPGKGELATLHHCVRCINVAKTLGEWGDMFGNYWQEAEAGFARQDFWRRDWEAAKRDYADTRDTHAAERYQTRPFDAKDSLYHTVPELGTHSPQTAQPPHAERAATTPVVRKAPQRGASGTGVSRVSSASSGGSHAQNQDPGFWKTVGTELGKAAEKKIIKDGARAVGRGIGQALSPF